MLPTLIAQQIQDSIRAFLQQMFPCTTEYFRGMVDRLTWEENNGLFRGPWYELRLPFESVGAETPLPFRVLNFPFKPHKHQAEAFARLCGDDPKSTLVTTGTGSGKTECFMFPVLDYCARKRLEGQKGIKAIFLYPMNALATDQARRLARAVAQDAALAGLRVGMYVGGATGEPAITMGPEQVITSRDEMRKNPPDILMTNYKMLDYLLLRADDRKLWQHNREKGVLRYLVVDELHTFDGAQATDLACLIRRVKNRVRAENGELCCIGTSATIGGDDSVAELCDYAGKIFGEAFDETSLIRETMMTTDQFRKGEACRYFIVPDGEQLCDMQGTDIQNPDAWLRTQHRLWFDEEAGEDFQSTEARLELGTKLLGHRFTSELLSIYEQKHTEVLSEQEVHKSLLRMEQGLADKKVFRAALDSFLALCAHARYEHPVSGRVQPFLRLHVQLWMRELTHMVTRVLPWDQQNELKLCFRADQPAKEAEKSLSLVFCRDCGTITWGAVKPRRGDKLITASDAFYREYFSYEQSNAVLLHPVRDGEWKQNDLYQRSILCGHCMNLCPAQGLEKHPDSGQYVCPACKKHDMTVPVDEYPVERKKSRGRTQGVLCPKCGAADVMLVGSRAAGLNSAAISTLYASACNDDKKLLTFSDNVQDASHRAGFFAGRTYGHTLRSAFYKAARDCAGMNLAELYDHIGERCCAGYSAKEQVRLFMPPDKEWLRDYESFLKDGKIPKAEKLSLPELIEKRLNWEFFSEITWKSTRGRTLERTGCLTLGLPVDTIRQTAEALQNECKEHLGASYHASVEELAYWITGVLHKLRMMGGVAIPFLKPAYEGYQKTGMYLLHKSNKQWMRSQSTLLSPRFFFQGGTHDDMLPIHTKSGRETWMENWALRIQWPVLQQKSSMASFIDRALKEMVKAGLLKRTQLADLNVWSVSPDCLTLSTQVQAMQCSHCGGRIYTDANQTELYTGMPCLKQDCPGHYTPSKIQSDGSRFYAAAEVSRIHAAEHTGLLEREDREATENSFIHANTPVPPNLLSCTPTLEMGIDIGDLSSVLLCSVPPNPANYRQRIGRAGRKDGNAFSLTTANGKANDLYFFQEPDSMIHGHVEAPGVYLESLAILKRQMFAFALDEWIYRDPNTYLPRKMRMLLSSYQEKNAFPDNFLDFCKRKSGSLCDTFCELLDLDGDTKALLMAYLSCSRTGNDSLRYMLTERINRIQGELESYRTRRASFRAEQDKVEKRLEQDTVSEEERKELLGQVDELKRSRASLTQLINGLRNKETLQFLTDEGLLPNYEFPEEGVTLKTVILKDRGNDTSSDNTESHEYTRAAASAISEFAPGSVFYVQGRKVKIDQVNLKTAKQEDWNFCPECSCVCKSELAGATCPQCGASWQDGSHQRPVLKFNQVMATVIDRDARSLDAVDERKPMFYEKGLSVEVAPQDEGTTWLIKSNKNGLAFSFLRRAIFRELNFGKMEPDGGSMEVNGRKLSSPGFRICGKCGKLMDDSRDFANPKSHDLDCPYRKNAAKAAQDALVNIFLYREIQSEAIRILLPGACADNDVWRSSFEAALQLGIKAYFKGRVANLKYCFDSMVLPAADGTRDKRDCLLIYDSVPGGTGNLKELTQDPATFVKVLQLAMKHITSCKCGEDSEKDGCHRCMYAFRGPREIKPSRSAAIEILSSIGISEFDDVPLPTPEEVDGPGSTKVTNIFISSELESRFIEWLRRQEGFVLEEQVVNRKTGYLLKTGNMMWDVEPQRAEKGGSSQKGGTVTDFTFTPVRSSQGRPIVVYLDGFAYHASMEHNRVSGDIEKREKLRLEDDYIVWTLTWDDIQNDFIEALQPGSAPGSLPDAPVKPWIDQLNYPPAKAYMEVCKPDMQLYQNVLKPIVNLKTLLENGENDERRKAWMYTAAILAMGMSVPGRVKGQRMQQAREVINTGSDDAVSMTGGDGADYLGYYVDQSPWRILWQLARTDGRALHQAVVRLSFDSDKTDDSPEYQRKWRGFWSLYNMLQILPHFRATTPELGQQDYRCEEVEQITHQQTGLTADMLDDLDSAWVALLLNQPLLQPELFYEVTDNHGVVVDGNVEVAWPEQKVAILTEDYEELADNLNQWGWRTFVWGRIPEADLLKQLIELVGA